MFLYPQLVKCLELLTLFNSNIIPLVVIGGLAALTAYTYYGQNLISAEEAKRLIKDGKIKKVIDVRTIT